MGALLLTAGPGMVPLQAGEITPTTGPQSLNTVVVGPDAPPPSCSSGLCTIGGGTPSGPNLYHRFDAFDTRGSITGVNFLRPDGINSMIVGVLAPTGSFINKPLNTNGANLFWLSPGGISIGSGAQFLNVPHLTLSTATDLTVGSGYSGFITFNYLGTDSATIASSLGNGYDNPLPNGLGSQGLTFNPTSGPITSQRDLSVVSALLTVDQSLLLDAGSGTVSVAGSSLRTSPTLSGTSLVVNAANVQLSADSSNRQTVLSSGTVRLTATDRISISRSNVTATDGTLRVDALVTEPGGRVTISNSTLTSNGGDLVIRGDTGTGGTAIQVSGSSLTSNAGNLNLNNSASDIATSSGTGILIDNQSSLSATSGGFGGQILINAVGSSIDCLSTNCFSRGLEIRAGSSLTAAESITLLASGGFASSSTSTDPTVDTTALVIASSTLRAGDDLIFLSGTNISILGTAGAGSGATGRGVVIESSRIQAAAGLSLEGNGTLFSSGDSSGLVVRGSRLAVFGEGSEGGGLDLIGRAGSTFNSLGPSRGVWISDRSLLTSSNGGITITGTGGSIVPPEGQSIPGDSLNGVLIQNSSLRSTNPPGFGPLLINSLVNDSIPSASLEDSLTLSSSNLVGFDSITITSASRLNLFGSTVNTLSDGQIQIASTFIPISPTAPDYAVNLKDSTLSTFPRNVSSGSGDGGRIVIRGDTISASGTTLRTSGTAAGGEITIGTDSFVNTADPLTESVFLFRSSLNADPPLIGGRINIYGRTITVQGSSLNLKGGSGGSLFVGAPRVDPNLYANGQVTILTDPNSNTETINVDSNSTIYSSSTAPLLFTSRQSATNNSRLNPPPPDNPPGSKIPEVVQQTLTQDPLTTDPQTSTQIDQNPGPLLSTITPPSASDIELALNL
ncbi:MAG: beta strand repeat-containing protein, partial [Cyanobium sp.]